MIYEILDSNGLPVNRIVAEYEFVSTNYPGRFREAAVRPSEQDYEAAMVALFDRVAETRQYDNRVTCAMRASYPGPYQAEGAAYGAWMDQCYAIGYALQAQAARGEIPPPSIDELLASMPDIAWPA
jgi:hypothetical protein